MFNCEMIPAENVGVKHAKWDREDGYVVPRDCYNSYFYVVEDESLNVIDKFRLHGRRYIDHLTGGSALHMNLEDHLSKEQYRHLLRVAAAEGCNYFTFNIPNTVCNECGHIDKRYLKECPECHGGQPGLPDPRDRLHETGVELLGRAPEGGRTPLLRQSGVNGRWSGTTISTSYSRRYPGETTLAINITNCPNRCPRVPQPALAGRR